MRAWTAFILAVLSFTGGFASIGAAAADKDQLGSQKRCSQVATEYFATEYGSGIYNNDFIDPDTHKTLYDETRYTFSNNYNAKENKCFMVVTSRNITRFEKIENLAIWITMIDLNQRRVIGMFHQFNDGAHADVCFIGPRDRHSMKEWEFLLLPYMRD